jgi:membrane dipeptidase
MTGERFPGDGAVVNGCDPSVLDAGYLSLNRRSGVRAFATTVAVNEDFTDACKAIGRIREICASNGARVIQSPEDLTAEDGLGVILATQNTLPFDGSLERLDDLVDMGLRIVQLTYNEQNLVGGGCSDPHDTGLTAFGIRVVRRLQERGVAVDLSHCGRRIVRDTLAITGAPVMFTHANCDALCSNPRNRTDEEIREVAAAGGVIGLNAFPYFVDRAHGDVDGLARHAAHIAEITSVGNISLGLDFVRGRDMDWVRSFGYGGAAYPPLDQWPATYAEGIEDITRLDNLTAALERVGFTSDDVRAVFGANLRRALLSAWSPTNVPA